jgi:hypothetical protein
VGVLRPIVLAKPTRPIQMPQIQLILAGSGPSQPPLWVVPRH